jgi:tRNA dimethylallyltransferase
MNVYILYGQTATGKTAKAVEIAQKENGEIVNFDSRQIYQKLDIVTGKDIPKNGTFHTSEIKLNDYSIGYYLFEGVKVWLYDIVDPKKPFSSADYVECAELVIADIIRRGKTPILVGGTGYYLYHLLYGVPKIDVEENWDLRKSLSQKTVDELQQILKEKRPDFLISMNESDRSNPRRLIRRIEIASSGNELPTQPVQEQISHKWGAALTFLPFFHCSPEAKQGLIRKRVLQRIDEGAIEETHHLLEEGYSAADPGLNAIGYTQLIEYIHNNVTREQLIEQWITKEMQYSKRQKTFFAKLSPQSTK